MNTQSETVLSKKTQITGLVLTFNGARLLDACLDSLAFCDEILVVDSGSTDETYRIAEAHGAKILCNPWSGAIAQFAFAFEHIQSDWVVSLDQDELCSETLRDAILCETAKAATDVCGFVVSRRTWYYDRFLLHGGGYPDPLLRVFRHGQARAIQSGAHFGLRLLHDTMQKGRIHADILHYPYTNFYNQLEKLNSYAQQGTDDLMRKGRAGGVCVALLHATGRFLRSYFLKRGLLDGKAGFISAMHGAFYVFLKYVRVHEGTWGAPYIKINKK